jgi:hypothetical protein
VTRFRTPDGTTVEEISLTQTSDHSDGAWLRVTGPTGIFVGQVRTVGELATKFGIDVADLVEESES